MPALSASAAVTVILVHGAWADGSSWNKVISRLQHKGVNVVAVQNPLTSLADDVAATHRAIAVAPGPVVLVGHSWGGAVITQAGDDPKVKALVYVAAFAPPVGMSVNDMGKGTPPSPGAKEIVANEGYLTISKMGIVDDFAQDLPKSESEVLAATQGPAAAKIFDDKITYAAWAHKPSWYLASTHDRMIDPDAERAMARAINAAHTVEIAASHVSMLSKPDAVTSSIEAAIEIATK
jgi:pimeloyl-ACP methyl ester carboxylesterase